MIWLLDSICYGWVSEHRFNPKRRWRFDYAHPQRKIAIEVEGGTWVSGRHNRGKGFIADMEKYNAAGADGWTVFRFTPQQMDNGHAMSFLTDYLRKEGRNNVI